MMDIQSVADIVWRSCWQSTALAAVVAVLVYFAGDRIAPRWRFLMWGLVLCRLAIVVAPPSPMSGFNLLAFAVAEPTVTSEANEPGLEKSKGQAADGPVHRRPSIPVRHAPVSEELPTPQSSPAIANETEASASPQPATPGAAVPSTQQSGTTQWLGGLWLIGFVATACYLIVSQLQLRRLIGECCAVEDEHLLQSVESLCSELQVRHIPELLVSPRVTSPFACGVWRPSIVVPECVFASLSDGALRCVIAHELAHIKRRDMLVQWCALAISCLYWFHPVAWFATSRMRRCREVACDEIVLQRLGNLRQEYGRALLQVADRLRAPLLVPSRCGLFGSRRGLRARIERVAKFRQRSPLANGAAVVALVALMAIGLTDAVPDSISHAAEPDDAKVGNTRVSLHAASDRTISGKCLRAEDQSPVADARIVLYELRGLLEDVSKVAETKTGQDGSFEFHDLRPMSEHRFDERKYAMIAFAEGMPHSFVTPIAPSDGMHSPQHVWMNFGPVIVPGKVVNEQGAPVAGAIVQLGSTINAEDVGAVMATTDQQGEFALSGAAVRVGRDGELGEAYLRVRHRDYSGEFVRADLKNHSEITLQKTECALRGEVVDADSGQPIPDVVVSAIPFESGDRTRKVHVKTDDNGRYELKVAQGKYKVVLDDDMHRVAEAQVVLCRAQDEPYELPPFETQAGGWIVGRIVNTKTGEPVAFSPDAQTPDQRVCVGLFGPSRPKGNLIYTEYLAEVDDDGYFRMRAFPGENYPYVCNMRCSRNTFTTMKQPAVIVEAGKETRYDIEYTPEPTAAGKMARAQRVLVALPTETEARVAGIIDEFRNLNHTVDKCEVWCLLLRELVDIGETAVPALCNELEATQEQRMIRRLAFALRAIGDPRAVPTLIRVLPKTLQPPMSDYGLIVEDGELAAFMRKHQVGGGRDRGNYFSFARPVREVNAALKTLTGHRVDNNFMNVSKSKDLRALAKQEGLYRDAAESWATWYEANWESLGVGQQYSKVNLPPYVPRELGDYPKGLEVTKNAQKADGVSGMVLTPVGDADTGATFFLDLDTGQGTKWPHDELPAADSSERVVDKAKQWAAKNSMDLLCTTLDDDSKRYVLVSVDLQLWEIDPFDAKHVEQFLADGALPKGEPLSQPLLLHYDPETREYTSPIGSSFLYVTREQGLGIITITDTVTQARDITGMVGAPKGVGFHRGVRFDYHSIAR